MRRTVYKCIIYDNDTALRIRWMGRVECGTSSCKHRSSAARYVSTVASLLKAVFGVEIGGGGPAGACGSASI